MFLVRIGMPVVRVADVFDENTVAVVMMRMMVVWLPPFRSFERSFCSSAICHFL